MRRFVALCSAAALSLVAAVVGTSAVASGATDTTPPVASDGHPILGTWTLTDTTDPEDPSTFVASFSGVGNYVQVEEGEVNLGVWGATGPTSAALTITGQEPPEEGGGSFTIRATIEVAPDGQSLAAEYTVEVSGVEGAPTGEYGPGQVTGTRVAVEPMGTPVGSLDELFAGFEEGTEVGDSDGGGEFADYCTVVAELDAQEGSPTPEQLEELRGLAPVEIAAEINAIVDGFLAQGPAFFGSEEAAELFEPIEAFEAENCPGDSED
jgi:hypothetical protein